MMFSEQVHRAGTVMTTVHVRVIPVANAPLEIYALNIMLNEL
jgi:hypothetical protein